MGESIERGRRRLTGRFIVLSMLVNCCSRRTTPARRVPLLLACPLACLASALACLALLCPASALASSSYVWTGGSAPQETTWSMDGNWESQQAPSANSVIGSLEFPHTASNTCTPYVSVGLCLFESFNDLVGLSVESMHIDDAQNYEIFGNQITLGAGGLSAAPSSHTADATLAGVELPIELSASQTWHIEGEGQRVGANQLYLAENLTGPGKELTVDVTNLGTIDLAGENSELGPVSFAGGSGHTLGGIVGLFGGGINAIDGEPVNVENVFFYGAGGLGDLRTTDSAIFVAVSSGAHAEGTLETTAVKLDSQSALDLEIAYPGSLAGSDYAQLTSTGAIELAGAKLGIYIEKRGKEPCTPLTYGQQDTLVSTTGGLSGSFSNAPQGAEIPIHYTEECGSVPPAFMRIGYNRGGSPQTVTGTPLAGVESATSLASSSLNPTTGQTVTLTARVATEPAYRSSISPWGTVEFENGGVPIAGCGAQQVDADNAGFTATCNTSFVNAGAQSLAAVFTPGPTIDLMESTSEPLGFAVSQASGSEDREPGSSGTGSSSGGTTGTTTSTTAPATGAPAPKGEVQGVSISGGGVSLRSVGLAVLSMGWAKAKLLCTAPGGCHGKLVLLVKSHVKAKGRKRSATHALTIATTNFTLSGGALKTIKLKLDAAGRALLRADHGHLAATLEIVALAPSGGAATQSQPVRLSLQGGASARHGGG
jgi:hypothetical protein